MPFAHFSLRVQSLSLVFLAALQQVLEALFGASPEAELSGFRLKKRNLSAASSDDAACDGGTSSLSSNPSLGQSTSNADDVHHYLLLPALSVAGPLPEHPIAAPNLAMHASLPSTCGHDGDDLLAIEILLKEAAQSPAILNGAAHSSITYIEGQNPFGYSRFADGDDAIIEALLDNLADSMVKSTQSHAPTAIIPSSRLSTAIQLYSTSPAFLESISHAPENDGDATRHPSSRKHTAQPLAGVPLQPSHPYAAPILGGPCDALVERTKATPTSTHHQLAQADSHGIFPLLSCQDETDDFAVAGRAMTTFMQAKSLGSASPSSPFIASGDHILVAATIPASYADVSVPTTRAPSDAFVPNTLVIIPVDQLDNIYVSQPLPTCASSMLEICEEANNFIVVFLTALEASTPFDHALATKVAVPFGLDDRQAGVVLATFELFDTIACQYSCTEVDEDEDGDATVIRTLVNVIPSDINITADFDSLEGEEAAAAISVAHVASICDTTNDDAIVITTTVVRSHAAVNCAATNNAIQNVRATTTADTPTAISESKKSSNWAAVTLAEPAANLAANTTTFINAAGTTTKTAAKEEATYVLSSKLMATTMLSFGATSKAVKYAAIKFGAATATEDEATTISADKPFDATPKADNTTNLDANTVAPPVIYDDVVDIVETLLICCHAVVAQAMFQALHVTPMLDTSHYDGSPKAPLKATKVTHVAANKDDPTTLATDDDDPIVTATQLGHTLSKSFASPLTRLMLQTAVVLQGTMLTPFPTAIFDPGGKADHSFHLYNQLYSSFTLSSTSTYMSHAEFIFSFCLRGRMCGCQAHENTHAMGLSKSFKVRPKRNSELLNFFIVKSSIDPG